MKKRELVGGQWVDVTFDELDNEEKNEYIMGEILPPAGPAINTEKGNLTHDPQSL